MLRYFGSRHNQQNTGQLSCFARVDTHYPCVGVRTRKNSHMRHLRNGHIIDVYPTPRKKPRIFFSRDAYPNPLELRVSTFHGKVLPAYSERDEFAARLTAAMML